MIDVGKVCVKIAGRDAGKKAVVVEKIDKNFVTIDGETRRKRCNIAHLEPLNSELKIKKGASHNEVVKAFATLNIEIKPKKSKKPGQKPVKVRKSLLKEKKEVKKKEVKKKEVKKKEVKKETEKTTSKKTTKKVTKKVTKK